MENYLSELVGVKVDLVEKSALKPRIGRHIKRVSSLMKREIGDYIEYVITAMDKAMNFVKNVSYQKFIHDDKTVFAVLN